MVQKIEFRRVLSQMLDSWVVAYRIARSNWYVGAVESH